MLTDHRCTKYTDCSSCSFYQRDIFKYRLYPKGYVIPQTRCMQNMVFFLVKGEIWLNSEEHPDTTFRGGQFVLQPIGSKVECKVLDYTECIIYLFERPQNICDNRFNKGISIVENERQQPIVMTMIPPIQLFIEGMKLYLNDDLRCSGLMQAKRSEMVYLLNCYYPIKELAAFYAPIYRYSHSFQYFVMQNYQKAKDVETFAQLGGYSGPTFRRIFKDTFGEPAYQWMLKRKCQDIHNDLIMTELSISEICYKYGFESLSNFSHFCRANFGQSPRSIRSLKDENT